MNWIIGPPPDEDDRYVVKEGPYLYIVWRHEGSWKFGDGKRCERGWLVVNVEQYLCIPDIPKPLPLPRRFRAKYRGIPVVGCWMPSSTIGGFNMVTIPEQRGEALWAVEQTFTDLEFIDPAEPKEAKKP